MTTHSIVLAALRRGPIDLDAISERMGCSRKTASNRLSKASADGLVVRLFREEWGLSDAGKAQLEASR